MYVIQDLIHNTHWARCPFLSPKLLLLNCFWVAPHKSWVTGNTLTSEEDPILSQESKVSGSRQSTLNIFCSFPVHSTERCAVKWTSFYCLRSSNPSPLKATNSLQRPIFFEPILDRQLQHALNLNNRPPDFLTRETFMKFKPFQQLASALIFCEDRLFGLLTTASHRLVFRVNPFLTIVYLQFMSLGVKYQLPHPKHII